MSTIRHSVSIVLMLVLLSLVVIVTMAARSKSIDRTLGGAANTVQQTTEEVRNLASDLRKLTSRVDREVEGVSGGLVVTLGDLQGAATSLSGAAGQLEQILDRLEQPVDDFAATGLYEFTQLIGETRLLVASLSRISKEFERDPSGSLFGRGSGYRPE
jgi:phospholipid/cholesterol/gamma-HCH transport system substrate-binding protein